MAEGGTQENFSPDSFPLSDEACKLLLLQLEGSFADTGENMLDESIQAAANSPVPDVKYNGAHWEMIPNDLIPFGNISNQVAYRAPSSLPATENWPGDCHFNVSFKSQENVKGVNWIFSKDQNKLYVGKEVPCPINFQTSVMMTSDVIIRAMALFSSSEHISEVAKRCVNHSMSELDKGIFQAEHLIRCVADSAFYEEDPVTKRHSVLVPYENPAAGQQFSSFIYKFMCFGSCSGGPNRRPLMLVFTLEKGGTVIGRQKVDLKICACPGRDYRSDEKVLKALPQGKAVPAPKPTKRPNQEMFGIMPEEILKKSKPEKEPKPEKERGKPYIIEEWDKKNYKILVHIQKYLRAFTLLRKHYPRESDWVKFFSSTSSSSDE